MRNTAVIELNLFYQHIGDAKAFLRLASAEASNLKSFYSRHAILSAVFASEALINRVYAEFYLGKTDKGLSESIDRLPFADKWLLAPLLCGGNSSPGKTFDRGAQPFQGFRELIKIRDSLVHPKAGLFVDAEQDGTISLGDGRKEVPYFRVLPDRHLWPQTGIPKNPFEMNPLHGEKAIHIVEGMIDCLLDLFRGVFDREWLMRCEFKAKPYW